MFRRGLILLLSILIAFSAFAAGRAAAPPEPLRTLQTVQTVAQMSTLTFPVLTFPAVVTVLKSSNVRSGPGTEYAVISGARPGQRLTVIGCNFDCSWYKLANDCWIAAFLVRPEQPAVTGPAIIGVQLPTDDARVPTVVVSIPLTTGDLMTQTTQTTRCPQTMAAIKSYAGPGTFYLTAGTLPARECVSVVGRNTVGDWFQLSYGTWVLAAAILYAEPLETMPVTDRFFTATPEPTPTPRPTETPTPEPTAIAYAEILTIGEWMQASPEQKAASAFTWTLRLAAAGLVTTDTVFFAADLLVCMDNTLSTTAELLGPEYPAQEIAASCTLTLND